MFKRNLNDAYFVPAYVLSLYQEGGELKYQEPEQVEDPMQQIMMMAQQAVEQQDSEMAMAVCQALVQLMNQEADQSQMEEMDEESAPSENMENEEMAI